MKNIAGISITGIMAVRHIVEYLIPLFLLKISVNRYQFIDALESLMRYHESCGIEGYHSGDCLDIERIVLSQLVENNGTGNDELQREEKGGGPGGGVEVAKRQESTRSLSALNAEISQCRNCSLHRTRQISTSGNGGGVPPVKLLIVGDWLTASPRTQVKLGDLFGTDQDMMLARMIAAMGLGQEEVFITNVIKCSIPETSQPTSEHISSCSNYLGMQIEYLQPQVICSMGIIASRLLTSQAKPLSQQRGHFFSYKSGSGRTLPVMPTYHPTFLLQNPEMKQATWADLQAVKKKIAG